MTRREVPPESTRDAPDFVAEMRAERTITVMQRQLLERVAVGRSDKEIAHDMGISYRTVRTHLERLFVRFGVHSRAALAVRWSELTHEHPRAADIADEQRKRSSLGRSRG